MVRPAREVIIDGQVVAALLGAQHPDLLALPRRVAAEGWDNVMIRLGDDLALRLPRRELAAELANKEARWLPELAPRLPVRVPVPVRMGKPQGTFPWGWSVVAWLPGTAPTKRPRQAATGWAEDLALALAALHQPAPRDAPHNPVRGVPLPPRDAVVMDRLRRGAGAIAAVGVGAWERLCAAWRRGVAAPPWPGPNVWVHGDPHPGNLLVRLDDAGDELAAVLDFGDLCAGDPACDLAAAWLCFDATGRAAFTSAYEASAPLVDPGLWHRAAAWAVSMASSIVVDAPGDEENLGWARAALAEFASP